jgi:hypothetical protein
MNFKKEGTHDLNSVPSSNTTYGNCLSFSIILVGSMCKPAGFVRKR